MMREREENISCFLSYEGCIFNDINMCTYSYPERREDIWIGRALDNGEKDGESSGRPNMSKVQQFTCMK